jgi:hypothetical protein
MCLIQQAPSCQSQKVNTAGRLNQAPFRQYFTAKSVPERTLSGELLLGVLLNFKKDFINAMASFLFRAILCFPLWF